MSILNQTPAERIAARMIEDAGTDYRSLKAKYERGFELFWRHPDATPQEIAAALGTAGLEVFQFHSAIRTAILAVNPSEVLPSVVEYGTFTADTDGSLTINSVVQP